MKLYFLRHGLAGERGEWQGDDFDRPLTDEGKAAMAREGAIFAALDLGVEAIITSPLVRARQTAEIAAQAMGLANNLIEDRRLEPGFDQTSLGRILKNYPKAEALMLVGHEPDFSQTITSLIGGGRLAVKKGALACVKIPDLSRLQGELLWLIPPRALIAERAGSNTVSAPAAGDGANI